MQHQDVQETLFNCFHMTLIADSLFTVIVTITVPSPTFAAPSVKLLSGAVSMKDMLFVRDFIQIVVIQSDFIISSM